MKLAATSVTILVFAILCISTVSNLPDNLIPKANAHVASTPLTMPTADPQASGTFSTSLDGYVQHCNISTGCNATLDDDRHNSFSGNVKWGFVPNAGLIGVPDYVLYPSGQWQVSCSNTDAYGHTNSFSGSANPETPPDLSNTAVGKVEGALYPYPSAQEFNFHFDYSGSSQITVFGVECKVGVHTVPISWNLDVPIEYTIQQNGDLVSSGSSTLDRESTPDQNGDYGILKGQISWNIAIHPMVMGDFAIDCALITDKIKAGDSVTTTCKIPSLNGFSNPVDLTCASVDNPSITCGLTPSSVTPPADGTGSSTLLVSVDTGVPIGTYNLQVTGTSGSKSHTTEVPVTVAEQDFSLSCSPADTLLAAQTIKVNCNVTSSGGGFNSPVDLTCEAPPESKITCGFSSTPVTPPADQAIGTTLVISANVDSPEGKYDLSIKGTSGTSSHTITVPVTVKADFSIDCPTAFPKVLPGGSAETACTINSVGGFNKAVDVSCQPLDNSQLITCKVEPGQVTPPKNGEISVTLTANLDRATPRGNHQISLIGKSGDLEHKVTANLVCATCFPPRTGSQTTSQAGLSAIEQYEGYAGLLKADCKGKVTVNCKVSGDKYGLYQDSKGFCTEGIGHLVNKGACSAATINDYKRTFGKAGMSYQDAQVLFHKDVHNIAESPVNNALRVKLTQEQFDALVSFTFNVGGGNFGASNLQRDINAGNCDPDRILHDFVDWSNSDNNNRRAAEANMFNS